MGRRSVVDFNFGAPELYGEDTHLDLAFMVGGSRALQLFYVHILLLCNENRFGISAITRHRRVTIMNSFRDTRDSDVICHTAGKGRTVLRVYCLE